MSQTGHSSPAAHLALATQLSLAISPCSGRVSWGGTTIRGGTSSSPPGTTRSETAPLAASVPSWVLVARALEGQVSFKVQVLLIR